VTDEKQGPLNERLERARRDRKLEPSEGHEISADGKEVRTPAEDEFFGNLEKALDELPQKQNGA
jgi:hypothetical protein